MTSPFLNRTYDMNYFLSFVDEEVMDISFHLIERIQNMNLNELENAMVAALVIMQPGG